MSSIYTIFLFFSYSGVDLVKPQFVSCQIGLIKKSFRCEIGISPNISKSNHAIAVKFSEWFFFTLISIISTIDRHCRYPLQLWLWTKITRNIVCECSTYKVVCFLRVLIKQLYFTHLLNSKLNSYGERPILMIMWWL